MSDEICLLLPPTENGFQFGRQARLLPLGLGVLNGYLRQRCLGVGVVDLNAGMNQRSRFELAFDERAVLGYLRGKRDSRLDGLAAELLTGVNMEQYGAFGISVGSDYSPLEINLGFVLGRFLEKECGKLVFFGGNNISYLYIFRDVFQRLWEAVLAGPSFVVKGPGERAVLAVLAAQGRRATPGAFLDTPGLVTMTGGQVTANPEFQPQVVRPDWDGLSIESYCRYVRDGAEDENLVQVYKWPDSWPDSAGQVVNKYERLRGIGVRRLVVPYIFNYNCPYNCAFCTQSDEDRSRVIVGEVETVLADISALMDKYATNYFYFLNNAFNVSPGFVDAFCHRVLDTGLKFYWSDCARFNGLTYERLNLMRRAGCVKLTFGLETASPRLISLVNKKVDLDMAEQVLKWCGEIGIWADLEIIVGLPQEREEDFQATYDFIQRNADHINYLAINEYFIVPNSLIGRYPERYGIEIIKDAVSYEAILERNQRLFRDNAFAATDNFKIYRYREVGGRGATEIAADNKRYIAALNRAQRPEFAEASRLYRMLTEKLAT